MEQYPLKPCPSGHKKHIAWIDVCAGHVEFTISCQGTPFKTCGWKVIAPSEKQAALMWNTRND